MTILAIALRAAHHRCSLLDTFGRIILRPAPRLALPLFIEPCLHTGMLFECLRVHLFLRQELLPIEMTIGTLRTSLGNIGESRTDPQTYIHHVSVSLIESGPRRVHLTPIVPERTYRYLKAERQDYYLCQLEQKYQDFL